MSMMLLLSSQSFAYDRGEGRIGVGAPVVEDDEWVLLLLDELLLLVDELELDVRGPPPRREEVVVTGSEPTASSSKPASSR